MRISRLNQHGDTIVEVMLAAAVLSMVLAGAFTISNRATRINQTANERTQVSNLMQREAELIRASFRDDPDAFWATMETIDAGNRSTVFCDLTTGTNVAYDSAFWMSDSLNVSTISGTFSDAVNDNFDIWVEPEQDPSTPSRYADFHIYACWNGAGGEGVQRTGLVMRLAK